MFDYAISELYRYSFLHVIFVTMVHMCCSSIKCLQCEGVVRLPLILSHLLDHTHWEHHIWRRRWDPVMASFDRIQEFHSNKESVSAYVERVELFFMSNGIEDN